MAFADFLDLQVAVVEQAGNPGLVDVFPRLVLLAEVAFNRRVRCREQITSTTLTFASGSATLPTDFLEIIGLYDAYGREYIQQPLQMSAKAHTTDFYAIGSTAITTEGADGDRTLQYYAKIPTLTTSMTTSNWLLQKHPGLYLYGVGFEAAKYMKDVEAAQAMDALREMEFTAARAEDDTERYSRARVRVAGVTP